MQRELLKNYFLGLLDPDETEKVDLQILEDSGSEQALVRAEDDLIEAYLDNDLSETELEAFHKNFLITAERRMRVAFLRSLRTKARGFDEAKPDAPGFFEKLVAFLTLKPVAVALAAVVLIAAVGIGWRLIFDGGPGNGSSEIIALNKRDLSDLGQFRNAKTFTLTPGSLRSTETAVILSKQGLTEEVLFRLALPNRARTEKDFTVEILKDGQSLQTLSQKPILDQEIRILLPNAIFTEGEYQITIEKGAEKFSYYFAVR